MFDPYTWTTPILPYNVSFKVETRAEGILTEQRFMVFLSCDIIS
jgi:hypothetical protein